MRIIGHIEHPQFKISIFKMDNRVSVKFENALYEQTFKLGADERFASVEAIEKLVDTAFLERVSANFQQMHQAKMTAIGRAFSVDSGVAFEEII